MIFQRPTYLAKLIELRDNGIPKVVTGVRRSGKTYLLFDIYRPYLLEQGVKADHIVSLDLSSIENIALRNPIELEKEVKKRLKEDGMNYVFIDEITLVDAVPNPALPKESQTEENQITFYEAVISLSSLKNVDLYVTGSNSKLLSKDVATRFRDRAVEIHGLSGSVTYLSKNTAICSVDAGGVISALSLGTTIVKVSLGDWSALCQVSVIAKSNDGASALTLSLSDSDITLYQGESYVLAPTLRKDGATLEGSYSYASSDETFLSISSSGVMMYFLL